MRPVLETALKTEFTPGSNRKGEMVTADWRFLLPRLDVSVAAFLGEPPRSTLQVFARSCEHVLVFAEEERASVPDPPNVERRSYQALFDGEIAEASVDLVCAVNRKSVRTFVADRKHLPLLSRILKPEGVLFFRVDGGLDRALERKARALFNEDGFGPPYEYYLAPALGRMRMAVPLSDREMSAFFAGKIRSHRAVKNRLLRSYAHLLGSYPRAVIGRKGTTEVDDEPPDYLARLCRKSGIDVSRYRWGVSTGGRYNAKKIVFYLFRRDSGRPEIVVKLTRSPEFNLRLENEFAALTTLSEKDWLPEGSFPRPLFLDYHNGLAVVGETVVHGRGFNEVSTGEVDCPYLRQVAAWLTELSVRSAAKAPPTAGEVGTALQALLDKFVTIYQPTAAEAEFLAAQVSRFKGAHARFPAVFQHGDAGSWNALILPEGGVAFVDWEAAESQGPPLWDLFYFMKTYGALKFRRAGIRDSLRAFRENYLRDSALGTRLVEVTGAYCQRLGLNRKWVEPLFYTCWVHRALKEATRLTPDTLQKGHYVNLLRAAMDGRETPVLKQLFSLGN